MPELPDIESYCHALRARVVGQPLEGFELLSPFVLRTVSPAPASVVGSRLLSVSRLGKRIVFSFEHDVHAVVHLMIAGRFRFEAATGKPPKPLSPRAGPLLRMTFPTGLLTLTEVSKRKRAKLHMVQGAVALAEHDPGGIEPLEVDAAAFRTALTAENHTIKRALTDPRVLSGIGNAYSD
ncbi:MAG: formamidopyrimidine-DNA glycosylase, partial [Myxococcales bacterium]|nr:formamidopyrimidine-DNA glycosylase [Myxococcales bacterium]